MSLYKLKPEAEMDRSRLRITVDLIVSQATRYT